MADHEGAAEVPGLPGGPPTGRPGGRPGARRQGADGAVSRGETAGQRGRDLAGRSPRIRTAATRTSPSGGRTSAFPSGRLRAADERRYDLAARLTERDRELLRTLARLRVLTAEHIAAAFFDSLTRAKARLLQLHRLGVVERFRPHAPGWGSAPYHYVLGRAGAGVLAAERGDDPALAERRWSEGRTLALGGSRRLAHTLGINGLWAGLAAAARRAGSGELVMWLTESEAAGAAGGGMFRGAPVQPDAYVVWAERDMRVEAFVEYDRGTEALGVLAAKLPAYARFEEERGRAAWVLFAFESPRREATARAALAAGGSGVAVATACLAGACPAGPVWLPLGRDGAPRSTLAALALVRMPEAARIRAADRAGRAWMYDRLLPDAERGPGRPRAAADAVARWVGDDAEPPCGGGDADDAGASW